MGEILIFYKAYWAKTHLYMYVDMVKIVFDLDPLCLLDFKFGELRYSYSNLLYIFFLLLLESI